MVGIVTLSPMPYLLVVEDDKDSAEALCLYLSKSGYEVDCKPNGREALTSILQRTPDLVILDLLMPYMDGPSLLEVLRSYRRFQSLPVVVFTGVVDSSLAERARHMNVSAILAKGKATVHDVLLAVLRELPPAPPPQGRG